jgi:hypothetical protein
MFDKQLFSSKIYYFFEPTDVTPELIYIYIYIIFCLATLGTTSSGGDLYRHKSGCTPAVLINEHGAVALKASTIFNGWPKRLYIQRGGSTAASSQRAFLTRGTAWGTRCVRKGFMHARASRAEPMCRCVERGGLK